MLGNRIPRVCFYFFSTDRNFEHFSPLRNGSERNSESFLFRGMVQNGIPRVYFYFCSMVQNSENSSPLRNGSERNSESFMFRGTAGIPPGQTNCSVFSVFRGIIFCRKARPRHPIQLYTLFCGPWGRRNNNESNQRNLRPTMVSLKLPCKGASIDTPRHTEVLHTKTFLSY